MCHRYAKMQYRSLSEGVQLTFDMVVPRETSTRHVASAAFYHCLGRYKQWAHSFTADNHASGISVLATKDLLKLEQPVPYESVVLEIRHLG